MTAQVRRGRTGRWWAVAAIGGVTCLFVACLWILERPQARIRDGLAAISAREWERLQYLESALPRTVAYRAPRSLFAAALALDRRDFFTAFRDLRFATADPLLQPRAWLLAGEALYAQGRFREAEFNFKHAIELDAKLADAHRWLAVAYYDVGLLNQAISHLSRVAELDSRDPRPHRLMALIYMDRGGNAYAVEAYQESLRRGRRQQDQQEILAELAICQIELNRWEDAQRTLAACAETPEVWAMRAETLYALGDREPAERLAQQAVDSGNQVPLALSVLAKLAFDNRSYDDAIELLTRAVEETPSNYQMHHVLVTALRASGRQDDAERQLAVAESLREAREQFDALVERVNGEPYDAAIRYELGRLAAQLGLQEMARLWLKAAVILDPNHRAAQAELKKHHGSAPVDAAHLLRGG